MYRSLSIGDGGGVGLYKYGLKVDDPRPGPDDSVEKHFHCKECTA
jgi:hypothetical protein